MKLKLDKVILLTDINDSDYYYHTILSSAACKEVDLTYGIPKTILDPDTWENLDHQIIKEPLFPQNRINPLLFQNITETTLIAIILKNNHLLINTVFSAEVPYKDVMYSAIYDTLLYLFALCPGKTLRIMPTCLYDNIGIISLFKNNLTNNILRNKIITLLDYEIIPEGFVNQQIFKENIGNSSNDIYITKNGSIIEINYKDNIYKFSITIPLSETMTILRNNVNTREPGQINEFWEGVRRFNRFKNNADSIKNIDHFESILKNFNRFIKSLLAYEAENEIKQNDGFARFGKSRIIITRSDDSISCSIPSDTLLHYSPDNIFNL